MKTKKMSSEPTVKEILEQSAITHSQFIDLLIEMREHCKLSRTEAIGLLGISYKDLQKYENKTRDMLLRNYCKYISIYYLYARSNGLTLPEKFNCISHFFMH